MPGEIDLGDIDAKIALDALRGPVLHDVTIKDLVLARGDFLFYALKGGIEEIGVPLGIP